MSTVYIAFFKRFEETGQEEDKRRDDRPIKRSTAD